MVSSLLAGLAVPSVAQVVPLTCDESASGSISTPAQVDSFSLTVTDNEIIAVTVVKTAPSGLAFQPSWRLVTNAGTPASDCNFFATTSTNDCGPLSAAAGPYRIEVTDDGNNDTGNYRVRFQRLTKTAACDSTPLTCDVAAAAATSDALDSDLFNFTVNDNEYVAINVIRTSPSGLNYQPTWRLLTAAGEPAPVCGFASASPFADCGPLPASDSPYQLEVIDQGFNDVGNYRVRFNRTTASAACDQTEISCDQMVTGSVSPVGDSDLYLFTVSDNEIISIQAAKTTPSGLNFAPMWRLIEGSGKPATSCGGFGSADFANCGPLPASGNPYRIEVADANNDDTGTYRLRLSRLAAATACEDTPLTCDVPVAGQINNALDSDYFSFPATDGEIVSVTMARTTHSGLNFAPYWRLINAIGNPVGDCGIFSTAGNKNCGPLPESGSPYRIEVMDQGNNDTGNYRVRLQRLTAAAACEKVDLTCDVPVNGLIDNALDSDLLSFPAGEGEYVSVSVVGAAPAGPNFTATWRLLAASGNPASACGFFDTSTAKDCGPLKAADSPYLIEISDQFNDDSGAYRARIQRITAAAACEKTVLTCDVPLAGQIDDPMDTDLFTFAVADNEKVTLAVVVGAQAGVNFGPQWRLLAANGQAAPDCSFFNTASQNDCGPLPAAGSPYVLEIADQGYNDTGSYRVRLTRSSAAAACENIPLTCDQPVTETIDRPLDSDLFSFSVLDNETVSITVAKGSPADANFTPSWRLIDAFGNAAVSCGFATTTPTNDCGPLPTAGNPYRVQVTDQGMDDTGTYRVRLQRIAEDQTCELAPINCDTPVSGTIEDGIDTDLLSFAITDNEIVSINVIRGGTFEEGFVPTWRLLLNSGSPAPACGFMSAGARDCGPLPEAGSPYRIEIASQDARRIGDYRARLQRLSYTAACDSKPLACDQTIEAMLDDPLDSDLHSFYVPEGLTITVSVAAGSSPAPDFAPSWRLLAASGEPAPDCSFTNPAGTRNCGPLPEAGSPYQIDIIEQGSNDTGPYTVSWKSADGQCPEPPAGATLLSAASRRRHGAGASFDIACPLVPPFASEPRQAGPAPAMTLTFDKPPEAVGGLLDCSAVAITNGTCTSVTVEGNTLIVGLGGLTRNKCLKVSVAGIMLDAASPTSVSVVLREGDVTAASGTVNILDLQAIKNQLNQPVGALNFRNDVTANGTINILDLQATKNNLNQAAACP